jgi:transposase
MQGKKHYSEKLFTHFQLSDRVPTDNFYRRLKEILALDWLYGATGQYYGSEGQQSIDPVVFMKFMLIGYVENLGSDRRIINTVSMRLDMLYFLGYDIDEPLPWHSTLSRTRQLYGEELFKRLFRQILKECIDKGMVAGRRQAMDSVFVKANASMESLRQKEIMDDGDDYLDELTDNKDEDDPNSNAPSNRKKEDHRPEAKTDKNVAEGKDHRKASVSNQTHQSTTDKDARISVKPGKPRRLNYLAQVSVDTAHHVITQIQSDYADKKDSQCLPLLLQNTIGNLKEQGLQLEEVLADGNYSSSDALQALEDNNIEGYILNFGHYKPSRDGFNYDEENDRYVCSQGKYLLFKKIRENPGHSDMKLYRSSGKDCKACPLKSKCIGKSHEKLISVTVNKALYDKMHDRLQTEKGKRMKKLRSSTVEPVLGTLVNFLGLRRLNTRGIRQANKCMIMSAVAYNLKKLLKWESEKVKAMAKAKIKGLKRALQALINLFCYRKAIVVIYSA